LVKKKVVEMVIKKVAQIKSLMQMILIYFKKVLLNTTVQKVKKYPFKNLKKL